MRNAVLWTAGVSLLALSAPAFAQNLEPQLDVEADVVETGNAGFQWEAEIELGVDTVFDSDDDSRELTDTYGIIQGYGEYNFGNGFSIFSTLTAESLTDPEDDRTFDDFGVYIEELGVRYSFGNTTLTAGKFNPTFGEAWDAAAGFYGGSMAEDYELLEQIGIGADVEFASVGGTLSAAIFYADDTALSESLGFDRGRNSSDDGGAGNTGELNNATLQWKQELGNFYYTLGARFLSAGEGDSDDETGLVANFGYNFDNGLGLFAEAAAFDGFGGSDDDANYLTLNAVYGIGDLALSGTYARRDIDSEGTTDLYSIAAEYELGNGMVLGAGYAYVDEAGTNDNLFGVNLIIPLGG